MKKILSLVIALCLCLPIGTMAAGKSVSNYDMVSGIGSMISTYGVYGDFHSEDLYLRTIAQILDNHPELYDEVLKSLVSTKDKYGVYYTKEEGKKLIESLSDSISGIGVTISSIDGNFILSHVLEGTPAEKAGLKEGDIIVSANGVPLTGMDLDMATGYIKGPAGTSVTLVVKRGGFEKTFEIIRQNISTNPIEYEVLDGNIGYIYISSFSNNAAYHFSEALIEFGKTGITDIIIDVRNNGGGYLDEAVAIADIFLPSGNIITTEDHKIDILDKQYVAKGKKPQYDIVVLINEHSASASEVLCAALTENGAATSIGTKSFGKGTVQTILSLPDGGMMKYTTAFYLTPKGTNIEGKGITPHIKVENQTEKVDITQFTELKYQNTYKMGMYDPEIKNAKEMLKFLGIYHGEVNECFDENLKITVAAIQKATEHLEVTGELTPETQIEILKILCETEIVIDTQLEQAKLYFAE